jgi:quercetin dioxygenase-like cupin family protein
MTPLLQIGGSTVTEHLGGEQTDGASALVEFHVEPGYPVPPPHVHMHEDEISFVLEGQLQVTVGDETRTIRPGEAIFKPRGVAHTFAIPGDEPVRFLETIVPAGFEGYFRAVAAMVRETGAVDRDEATRLMAEYGLRTA